MSDKVETGTRANDLTGRSRLVRNVLTSWAAYAVFVVSGFVMPRFMDEMIGQTSLGIWDFSWSLVSYFSVLDLGIGSSVNRYVAIYRSRGEPEKLSRLVSTVFFVQVLIGCGVLIASLVAVGLIPVYFADRLGGEMGVAQWVIALLSTSLAVEMMLNTSRGVITGCHRWDLHNGINAASKAIATVGMMIAIIMGGGLIGMGLVYLMTVVGVESYRKMMSFRACPELQIRLANVRWTETKEMLAFGVKTVVSDLPPLVFVQSASMIVVGTLGPAALAVFSRPLALNRHVQTLINKFAFVLVPMASSLHGSGNREELREFMLQMTRYSVIITTPLLITLGVFGDVVLRYWMGERYAHSGLMGVLALGYFLPVAQNSVLRVLVAMNIHGRVGMLCLVLGGIVFLSGSLVMMAIGWSMLGIGIVLGFSLTVGGGIVVPFQACRLLGVPLGQYFRKVFFGPLLSNVAYGGILLLSRSAMSEHPLQAFFGGICVGGALLGFLYWRFAFSATDRGRIRGFLMTRLGRSSKPVPEV